MVVLSSARCFIDLCCASQPSQQGRINWTVFLLLWLTSAYCEQCSQTPNDSLSGGKKKDFNPPPLLFCLLALAFPFEMTKFFGCALPLSWQVTSVKRNNLQYALTSLSTTNKERKRQMALLSLIAGTNKTARPSPGIKSCLAGNPLCLRRKSSCVAEESATKTHKCFAILGFTSEGLCVQVVWSCYALNFLPWVILHCTGADWARSPLFYSSSKK